MGLHRLWMIPAGRRRPRARTCTTPAEEHWATICLVAAPARRGRSSARTSAPSPRPRTAPCAATARSACGSLQFELPDHADAGRRGAGPGRARVPRHARPRDLRDLVARPRAGRRAARCSRRAPRVRRPRHPRTRRRRRRRYAHRMRCSPPRWPGSVGAGRRSCSRALEDLWLETGPPEPSRVDGHQNQSFRQRARRTRVDELETLDLPVHRRSLDQLDQAAEDVTGMTMLTVRRSLSVQRGPALPALRTTRRARRPAADGSSSRCGRRTRRRCR